MLQYCRRRFFNLFDRTWLRSGSTEYAYRSVYLTSSGYRYTTYSARRLAVRPALYMIGFSLAEKLRVAVMRGFINFPSSVLT